MSLPLSILSRNLKLVIRPGTGAVRLYAQKGYWNKDWMPALEPPKNEEEKKAAAKKYGMIVEDYKPEPADGMGHGDYPDLPIVSTDERNPNEAYDYPEFKRNFGEPLHVDADLYGHDKRDMTRQKFSLWQKLGFFIGACSFVWACITLPDYYVKLLFIKQMKKQMPNHGVVYYTFEKKV